jgi:hypothetical protein
MYVKFQYFDLKKPNLFSIFVKKLIHAFIFKTNHKRSKT